MDAINTIMHAEKIASPDTLLHIPR